MNNMVRMGGCQTGNCQMAKTLPKTETPCKNNIRGDRNALMKNIYELGFVLTETALYLDTHPDDAEVIEYYSEIKKKYNDCVEKYSDYYGPLNLFHISNDNYWMWVATPMPWEVEDC